MSNAVALARKQLLEPVGLDAGDLQKTLERVMARDVDDADLYFESTSAESWVLEDGIIKEGAHSIDQGVGVRAVSGEKSGLAYSDEIVGPALTSAADTVRAIARGGGSGNLKAWRAQDIAPLYTADDPLLSIPPNDKIALLNRIDAATRAKDPRV
ncbi:MAG TPA: DNA gyrase modulator, partial [Gammaproteobacteria bacterium]